MMTLAPNSSFGWSWVHLDPCDVDLSPWIPRFLQRQPAFLPPADSHPDLASLRREKPLCWLLHNKTQNPTKPVHFSNRNSHLATALTERL